MKTNDNKMFPVKIPMFQDKNKYNYKMCHDKNKKYLLLFVPVALFPKTGQTFNSIMMETSRRNQNKNYS